MPSLRKICVTCASTVRSATYRRSAIALFDSPSAEKPPAAVVSAEDARQRGTCHLPLRQEPGHRGVEEPVVVRDSVAARHQYHSRAGGRGGKPLGDGKPVELGKLDVEQDNVGANSSTSANARSPSAASPTTTNPPTSSSARAGSRNVAWSSTIKAVRCTSDIIAKPTSLHIVATRSRSTPRAVTRRSR